MPGIVGLITRAPRQVAELELGRMLATLRHEVFYETGTWINESLGVYVGWVSRGDSSSKRMPLVAGRGDRVLVFSGEDFSQAETLHFPRGNGHRLQDSDPSYLVRLSQQDPSFPASLNGRFHGVAADLMRKTVTLFNDRYGMHRIYYHESSEAFYFAAEAKAILAVRPELRTLELCSLGEYLSCGCTLENRTLFHDIHVLPAASVWTFENFAVKKATYFEPAEWENLGELDPQTYQTALGQAFSESLPRYFAGQNSIGMSLTGGLDTRMLMAWQQFAPGSLPCYSFGDAARDTQDVKVARRVAQHCKQPYQTIAVGDEFLNRFGHYAERSLYLTDGCSRVEHSADLYLNEKAREIAPVRMTGNYGGEVLRQVRAFRPSSPLPGLFDTELLRQAGHAEATYAQLAQRHPLSFVLFVQAPWHHYGLLALEQTQLSVRSPYLDNALVRTVFQAPQSCLGDDTCLRLIAQGDPMLLRIRTDRGRAGDAGWLRRNVSRSLLEFTFKAEYGFDEGMPQWVARIDHAFSRFHLERLFLGRHKFAHYRMWYRNQLSGYVRDVLLDPHSLSRPYVNRNKVEAIVRGHLDEGKNHTGEIHQLLTLELIHRLFVDQNGSRDRTPDIHSYLTESEKPVPALQVH